MNMIKYLTDAGIQVPDTATSYHTEDNRIVFAAARPDGQTDWVEYDLTDRQIELLRLVNGLGSYGWFLRQAV